LTVSFGRATAFLQARTANLTSTQPRRTFGGYSAAFASKQLCNGVPKQTNDIGAQACGRVAGIASQIKNLIAVMYVV